MTPISDDMVERALAAEVDQIQGFSYTDRSAIFDFRTDHSRGVELWSAPATPWPEDDSKVMNERCRFEQMKARLTAALEGSVAVPGPSPELVQQCKELLEWSKTGLLNGGSGGSVRKVAAEWEKKVGKHHALSVAESQIRDDAMREVVRLAGALPRHTSSPPPGSAPHNSGERLPSSDAATSGGDPADTRQERMGEVK